MPLLWFIIPICFQEEYTAVSSNTTVQIEVISRVIKNTLFIPVEAVFERQSSFYVYRRVGGTPKETAVSIGESNDNFVQITDGLEEGDVVYLYRPYDKKQSE